ncbi:LysE family transporter [Mangrovimonas aestuarii]|uniref:LysE family transporter n=1 Tax=Mangrovimonas aestuarii TaxID=3018443 RepID=UPI00237819B8|nr:LysE family transporter [Mangrovimonas aestuarii]
MNITIIFFLGLVVAAVGVIPPGLLNMTAAKISINESHNKGVVFSIGVCVVFAVQAYLAAIFAKYLSNHPDVIDILQRVAFVVFVLVTIYYLVIAKANGKPELHANGRSKSSRFFQGMFMSAINMLPIPYHAYMVITLATFGWLSLDATGMISYVAGAVMGTFIMLYVYMFFFEKISNKAFTSQKNMNYIIGGITGVISIITLINIIKEL